MELGGNDALIILADADLEKAATAVVLGRLARGNGQICCAVKRVLVEAPIYDKFADLLTKKARALKVGDQLLEDTDVGPLINEQAAVEVEAFVNGAVAGRGKATGGRQAPGQFHGADRADRSGGGYAALQGGGLRTGGAAGVLHLDRRGGTHGQ